MFSIRCNHVGRPVIYQAMNFITKNELLTRDVDTLDSQIVYQVSRPPVHGQLENVDHPHVVIMFFTQGTILSLSLTPFPLSRSPSLHLPLPLSPFLNLPQPTFLLYITPPSSLSVSISNSLHPISLHCSINRSLPHFLPNLPPSSYIPPLMPYLSPSHL